MNNRLRLGVLILGALCVANLAWRAWASWGLITINANKAPIATVISAIQKQAGIRLRTNLPAETQVTMHVKKVSLLHALEVLSASTDAGWNVTYFTAPDKNSIEAALAVLSSDQQPEGWKRFSFGGPGIRGLGGDVEQGASDPREDAWKPKPASEGTLHAYLQQAALMTTAQYWAPEQWNPFIPKPPKAGEVHDAVPRLVKVAHGYSAEVFFLRGRRQAPDLANADQENGGREGREGMRQNGGRRNLGEGASEEMRKAMEERTLAQIERLPKEKRAAALAEIEERKKFFAELALLSPEDRAAKMAEKREEATNNPEMMARMENGATKRSAMQTADQRAQRYKSYLDKKREATN